MFQRSALTEGCALVSRLASAPASSFSPTMAGGAPTLTQQAMRAYFYVVLWMTVRCALPRTAPRHWGSCPPQAPADRGCRTHSMAVILFNKWLLAYSGFPFPLALTMCVPEGEQARAAGDATAPPLPPCRRTAGRQQRCSLVFESPAGLAPRSLGAPARS